MSKMDIKKIEELRRQLEKKMRIKIKPKLIRKIYVNPASHLIPPLDIEIGKIVKNLEPDAPPEEIIAIFDSTTFLVCTQSRGIDQPLPYFFAREDVLKVEFITATNI